MVICKFEDSLVYRASSGQPGLHKASPSPAFGALCLSLQAGMLAEVLEAGSPELRKNA